MKRFRDFSQPNKIKELNYDEHRFYPTVRDVKEWFALINRIIFDGRLKLPDKLIVRTYPDAHAMFSGWTEEGKGKVTQIEVNKAFQDKKIFVEILAHEMIHLYQYQHREPVDHGPTFRKWRDRFIQNGLRFRKDL